MNLTDLIVGTPRPQPPVPLQEAQPPVEQPPQPSVEQDDFSSAYATNARNDEAAAANAWARNLLSDGKTDVPTQPAAGQQPPGANADLSPASTLDTTEHERKAYSTVARNVAEMPRAAAHGAVKGVNEALGLVYDLGDKVREWTPEWADYSLNVDFRDGAGGYNLVPSVSWDKGKPKGEIQIPQPFNKPETTTGELTSGVSQFLTGFFAGGRALKGIEAATTAGKIALGMAKGAISDFAFFDGQERNLSSLIQEFPALQNPVNEFLATSPENGEVEGRFKRTLEGMGLGAMAEGLLLGVKAIRSWRAARAAAQEAGPEAVQKAVQEIESGQAGMRSLGDMEAPLVGVSDAGTDVASGAALRGPRSAETETLEQSGFAVDRDVFEAPVIMDNKRRYGVRREALEAEGELGDRWTNIETKPEEWPELPENRGRKGEWINAWREAGKRIYQSVRGTYQVAATGENILVGSVGSRHILSQRQAPEAIKAVSSLPELIQKAFKTGEYNPKPSQAKAPDMRPTTIYHSAAVIDGTPYDVTLVAKRNAAGQQELTFYDLRARTKEGPAVTWSGNDASPLPAGPEKTRSLSDMKVADFFGDVKDIVDDIKPGEVSGAARTDEPGKVFINFSRIDSPDDVKTAMQQTADFYKSSINDARRGTRTFEQTTLSAEQEDAWKILSERRTGQPLNAEQSLAARNLWASSGQKLADLADLATKAPTEENLFAFRKMLEVHRAVQNEVVAARTETARALGSWRIPSGPKEMQLRQISEALAGSGGKDNALELAARVAQLSQSGMAQELDAFVAKSLYANTRDSIQEAWTMALLSNPKTHLVNITSNATVALGQVFERAVAGHIGNVLGGEAGVAAGESLAMLNGLIGGVKDGLRLAWKSMRTNEAGGWAGKIDLPHEPAISAESWRLAKDGAFGRFVDVLGNIVRMPGRALMAEDEFFKSIGYRAELHAQAYRQATREAAAGKIGNDGIRQRMTELTENPPDNIHMAAVDHATYATFQNAPGDFAKAWLGITRKFPAMRFITPFVKTPANIFTYAVAQRSPLAPLFRSFREDMAAGGARQQLALARVGTGTTVMLAAADLAFNGQITGGGPAKPEEKQALLRTGWQPYSVRIGDRYFSYNRMDPIGMTMGIAADLAEITTHMDHDDREVDPEHAATYFAATIAGNVMSKSYMRGLSDFVDTLANPQMKAEGFMQRFAGSFVPAVVAEVAKQQDPYALEVNSMLDAMKARIPGLSETLPPRRDLWGRAVSYRSGLGAIYDALSPIASRRDNPEPIDKEMLKHETWEPAPKRQVVFGGVTVDLTRDEFKGAFSRYAQLAGNELKHPAWGKGCMDYLNDVVTGKSPMSAAYDMRSDGKDGGKSLFIRATISQYRELAKKQLLEEYPNLAAYVEAKKAAKPGKFNL